MTTQDRPYRWPNQQTYRQINRRIDSRPINRHIYGRHMNRHID